MAQGNLQVQARRGARWLALLALPVVLVVTACASGKSASKSNPTGNPGTHVVGTTPPELQLTPIPGTYSIYIDPTWGYSFEYPSNWIVSQGIGQGESNVSILEPYTPSTVSPAHPDTVLMVRATNNFQHEYVQTLICGAATSTSIAGVPAVNLTTTGGTKETAYTAPAYGIGFFDKGLAFEIWLESSSKNEIGQYFDYIRPIWQHVLATFNPGPGAKTAQGC